MSKLLFNEENNDNYLIEKSSQSKAENDLETAIKDSTSDLPLEKALNLLLHIHCHIFDKAMATIRESSQAELTVHVIESPTIRAIISIENYLTFSKDIGKAFKQVYDSLEEKFIKCNKGSNNEQAMRVIVYLVLYSKHQTEAQESICKELSSSNKRSQLATVIFVQFLFTNYISQQDTYSDLLASFIPPLAKISKEYGNSPTLLACTSCDLVLQFSRYIALHLNSVKETTSKIVELQDTINDNTNQIQPLRQAWEDADILFYIMEKWHKSIGQLEIASFKELHLFLRYADKYIQYQDKQAEIIAAWDLIITWLNPKTIVSEKPLALKKQKAVLLFNSDKDMSLLSSIKIMILIILQKGRLFELYGPNKSVAIYSTEEQEIKELIQKEYKNMIQSFPLGNIGNYLILQLVMQLPFLCTTNDIDSTELIQQIVSNVEYTKETGKWLLPLLMKQPESSICNLLWHILEQDDKSETSYDLLADLIDQNSSEIIEILENNLLTVVKNSNQACELLIQCMEYTHLPSLIRKLMPFIATDDQREKMLYIALISKALLHHQWASNSILFYIELVREFQLQKGFATPVKLNFSELKKLTPNSMTHLKPNLEEITKKYSDEEMEEICTYLMAPIQLWCTKANENTLESALVQLVHKSYGLPGDPVCIDAWRNLSSAFINNPNLVWVVIQQCLDIMQSQSINDQSVTEIMWVTPMLILQTIPKQSYDIVKLTKSYVDLLANKFEMIHIDLHAIKLSDMTDESTQISIQLMDQLLIRCFYEDWKHLAGFSIGLVTKIFCK